MLRQAVAPLTRLPSDGVEVGVVETRLILKCDESCHLAYCGRRRPVLVVSAHPTLLPTEKGDEQTPSIKNVTFAAADGHGVQAVMPSSAGSAGRGTLPDALSMHSRCLAVVSVCWRFLPSANFSLSAASRARAFHVALASSEGKCFGSRILGRSADGPNSSRSPSARGRCSGRSACDRASGSLRP